MKIIEILVVVAVILPILTGLVNTTDFSVTIKGLLNAVSIILCLGVIYLIVKSK